MRRAFKGSLATHRCAQRFSLRLAYHAGDGRCRSARPSSSRSSPATPRISRATPRASILIDETERARRSAARRAADAPWPGRAGAGGGGRGGGSSPGIPRPLSMPTSPISASGASRSRAPHYIGGFGRIFDLVPGDLLAAARRRREPHRGRARHRGAYERGPCRCSRALRHRACRRRSRSLAHDRHRPGRLRHRA